MVYIMTYNAVMWYLVTRKWITVWNKSNLICFLYIKKKIWICKEIKCDRKKLLFSAKRKNLHIRHRAMMRKHLVFNTAGLEVICREEAKTCFKPASKLSECGARLASGYQDKVTEKLLVMRKKLGHELFVLVCSNSWGR